MRDMFGPEIEQTFQTVGIPKDVAGAQALFKRSPFEFERWAVSLVDGQPNEKQVGDRGIDGVVRFPVDAKGEIGRVIVSVKGGGQINPNMVRDFIGTVDTQKAEMGILIAMEPPTRGMLEAANHAGSYTYPFNERTYPRVQIVTVPQLLANQPPAMPTPFSPYSKAQRSKPGQQLSLG